METFLFGSGGSEEHGNEPSVHSGNVSTFFLGEADGAIAKIQQSFKLISIDETDTQFIRYKTDSQLVISFRGTASGYDGYVDSQSTLVSFADGVGRVHKGFLTAFLSVKSELDSFLSTGPGLPVILTGHSLGAAVATMAAAYIRHKHQRKVMLYTYGSPRVGDADFVRNFTHAEPFVHYRCIHNTDLVTMVPPPYANLRLHLLAVGPTWLSAFIDPFGKPFSHHGKPVWLRRLPGNLFSVDEDKKAPAWHKITKGAPIKESRPKWDAYLGYDLFSVHDHFMENYLSILGSDLRCSVVAFLENSTAGPLKNAQATVTYLEAELKLLRTERDRSIMANPSLADATLVSGPSSPNQLTPNERFDLLTRIINDKSLELSMEQARIARISDPGFAAGLLRKIGGGALTPALKRELEYQAEHIKY